MTTLAKIEANRLNAQRSTGPKTTAGKAVSSRNAITHGVWTADPVVTGEAAEDWAEHEAGVSESLAPVGLLEVTLAKRVAELLWRLGRVTRYETLTIRAAAEDAGLPRPRSKHAPFPEAILPSTPSEAAEVRRLAAVARKRFKSAALAAEYFAAFDARPDDESAPAVVASEVFSAAFLVGEEYDYTPPFPKPRGQKLLKALGRGGERFRGVAWTAGLIRGGLTVYARRLVGGVSVVWFTKKVGRRLANAPELYRQAARTHTGRAAGLELREQLAPDWYAAQALLQPAERADRVARYETHLNKLLVTTLQELERLQTARRARSVG